jgi:hypothetical protein
VIDGPGFPRTARESRERKSKLWIRALRGENKFTAFDNRAQFRYTLVVNALMETSTWADDPASPSGCKSDVSRSRKILPERRNESSVKLAQDAKGAKPAKEFSGTFGKFGIFDRRVDCDGIVSR